MTCRHEKTKIVVQENEHNYPFSFKYEKCLECGKMINPSLALRQTKNDK